MSTAAGDRGSSGENVRNDAMTFERVEDALAQSEAKYRSLFESIDEGFCIIQMLFDARDKPVDYRFLEVNAAFERQSGLLGAGGRTVRELVPGLDAHWFEIYGRVALTGEATRFQDHAAQLHRWYDVYAWRYGNPQNREVAVLFNDVTSRKLAEEALRQSERPLRTGLDLLGVLCGDAVACEEPLRIMDRQLRHLVHLVDDLLDVSRITRGMIALRTEPLDLAEIIDAALKMSESGLRRGERRLVVDVPPEPLPVEGDRVRLVQVASNLLNNAAKFTDAGGRITLRVLRRGDRVEIRVQDDGRGIPREHLAEIFEMFSQAEPGQDAGLGIGLGIVRSLVALHGGTVRAESDGPGRGAVFTVALPLCDSLPAQPGPNKTTDTVAVAKRRVLVVDDDRDIVESLRLLFTLLKAEVRVAYDGAEALRVCAHWQPTHILMDLRMPVMDGYEAARRLRADYPDRAFRLVAVTGWGQDQDRQRTREAGFDQYLVKPVGVEELKSILAS